MTGYGKYRPPQKYQQLTGLENRDALQARIRFVLSVAELQKADTLILGAFGCGVFGQEASEVARLFQAELCERKTFRRVVFAIPDGADGNFRKFTEAFKV